jgi:lipoprotein-anchoring transpeptidase ErfK/SrfK
MPKYHCGKTIARAVFIINAAVATLGAGMTPAVAQDLFHWVDGLFSGGPTRAWRSAPKHHPRTARKRFQHELRTSAAPSTPEVGPVHATPEQPLFLNASIADQRVSIYSHQGLIARSAISTGIAGHPTPEGIFTIIGRERYHRSNIYSVAPMPIMQRITWSGIAMHLGVVPGHPASHGCIRLPSQFAAKLWGWTKIGERVVISAQDIAPAEFAHPLLLTPKLRELTEADATPGSGVVAPLQPVNPFQYADLLRMKAAAAAQNVKQRSPLPIRSIT